MHTPVQILVSVKVETSLHLFILISHRLLFVCNHERGHICMGVCMHMEAKAQLKLLTGLEVMEETGLQA